MSSRLSGCDFLVVGQRPSIPGGKSHIFRAGLKFAREECEIATLFVGANLHRLLFATFEFVEGREGWHSEGMKRKPSKLEAVYKLGAGEQMRPFWESGGGVQCSRYMTLLRIWQENYAHHPTVHCCNEELRKTNC